MSQWTRGLNAEQAEAVAHDHGPLLILAGAGSGKTTVLVARAGRLLDEGIVSAARLCVLTFTNKAARELKSRVTHRLGDRAKGIWAGTFHSFGLYLLRRFHQEARLAKGFGILDASDAGSLVKELLRDFRQGDKTAYDADRLLSIIGSWRERGQREAARDEEYEVAVEWVLPRYLKKLELLGMVDFDSLILRPYELMKSEPAVREAIQSTFDQVMVDEFQDTNAMQMRLIQKLVDGHRNLAVVGDDDQSIYGWRGACISNILGFPKLYPICKVVRLEQNYRSTPAILSVANAVIAKNTHRHPKALRPRADLDSGHLPEIFVHESETDEAEAVCIEIQEFMRQGFHRRDIAVLYRSNSQGAMLEAELRKNGIPYLMSGGTAFFDRKETRDMLAYLRCAIRPQELALRRIINTPPRGIGDKTIELLGEWAEKNQTTFVGATHRWTEAGIEEKAGASLKAFWTLVDALIPRVLNAPSSVGDQLLTIFTEMGYREHVEKHSGNALVAAKRWRFVELFAGILDRFVEQGGRTAQTIKEFIDAMELRDTLEDKKENEDRVQLMTLHACKGLEFPVVFLIGVEEDLLPHKTLGSDISEERRLFYVGITRAQQRLLLSRVRQRRKHGKTVSVVPSRFLLEIPTELVKEHKGPRPVREETRKSMIADLFKKLDSLGAQPVPPKS